MSVYIACVDGFTDLSAVADGASEALEAHLGPVAGRPARSAIGVRALPGGAPVEIELTAVVELAAG
jgi:enamine deaminase RidA (YjgF/YER057c/UK114 family)